ncbi:MAG: hypothetical protein EAZ92_05960 [Candidatus Kapaibacterium sp.]|nr:MAG: hypothetical protein EAZ92_05960 [Candidatus Kapabacteria bacterium]
MATKIVISLFAFLSLAFLKSCTSSGGISQQEEALLTSNNQANLSFATPIELPVGMPNEQWLALSKLYIESGKFEKIGLGDWEKTARNSHDWRTVDTRAKAVIKGAVGDKLDFHVEQIIAYGMLRGVLLPTKPSQETNQAIKFYLDVLSKNRWIYDTKTIFQALERVQILSSTDEIAMIASNFITHHNEKQMRLLKKQSITEEEYLRRRAKYMVDSNPELFSSKNAEEELLQKLKQDRAEARRKSQRPEIQEQLQAATMEAAAEEQEREIYLQKLTQISKKNK